MQLEVLRRPARALHTAGCSPGRRGRRVCARRCPCLHEEQRGQGTCRGTWACGSQGGSRLGSGAVQAGSRRLPAGLWGNWKGLWPRPQQRGGVGSPGTCCGTPPCACTSPARQPSQGVRGPLTSPLGLSSCSPPPTKPASSVWKGSAMGISVEKEGRWGAGHLAFYFVRILHSRAVMSNDTAVSLYLASPVVTSCKL